MGNLLPALTLIFRGIFSSDSFLITFLLNLLFNSYVDSKSNSRIFSFSGFSNSNFKFLATYKLLLLSCSNPTESLFYGELKKYFFFEVISPLFLFVLIEFLRI